MQSRKGKKDIFFHYLAPVRVPHKTIVRNVITRILRKGGRKPAEINYVFCTDDYLLAINRDHLDHDYYTDIITFDLSESKSEVVADIYISADRVRENARGLKTSSADELVRVMFHGALHLAGFKDHTEPEKKKMRALEDYWVSAFERAVPRITVSQRNGRRP